MPSTTQQSSRSLSVHSLRDLYSIVFRHMPLALTCFAIGTALAFTIIRFTTPRFRSEARLLVRVDLDTAKAPTGSQALAAHLRSEIEILRSLELLTNVSAALAAGEPHKTPLNGNHPEEPLHISPDELMSSLRVELVEESNVITLSLAQKKAKDAQRIVAKVVELFDIRHLQVFRDDESYGFFLSQTEDLATQIAETESELFTLKSDLGVSSLDEDRRSVVQSISRLETQRQDATRSIASSRAKAAQLHEVLATMPERLVSSEATGGANTASGRLRDRLFELRLQEIDLLGRYLDNSRPVQDVRTQIAEAEGLLMAEADNPAQVTIGLNPNHQRISLDLITEEGKISSDEAELGTIEVDLTTARAALKLLNDNELHLDALERQLEVQRASSERYQSSLEQARIEKALEQQRISNIGILQPATLPTNPVEPGPLPLFLFGVFLSALMALTSTFVAEFFDDAVHTPDDMQSRGGLRASASLPSIRRWRLGDVPPRTSKAFRDLREQLRLSGRGGGDGPRFVAVTSAQKYAGVSTVAAGLASSLAQFGEGKVALVDANLDDPRISLALAEETDPGLSDAFIDGGVAEPPVHPLEQDGLFLIPVGTSAPLLAERLDPQRFVEFLRNWTGSFDYVIVDLPPLTGSNAFAAIAEACEDCVIVVEAGKTRWQVVQRTAEIARLSRLGMLGAVINKRRFPIPAWLYNTL